ncbi:hypothetical protein EV360DRAFT_77288, partial [Lentinula raphanica]
LRVPDLSAPQGNAAIPHYPATELLPTITEHPTVLAIPEHSAAPPPAHLDYILTVETEGRALTDIAQYELSMLGEIILKDWDGVQYSVQKNYHIITANNAGHPYLTYFTLEAAEGTRSLRCPHNNPCFGTCAPGSNERNWVIESMVLENPLIPHIEVSYDLPQENWILILGHMGVPTDIRWLLKFVGRHALIHWEGTPWRHPTFVNRDITASVYLGSGRVPLKSARPGNRLTPVTVRPGSGFRVFPSRVAAGSPPGEGAGETSDDVCH